MAHAKNHDYHILPPSIWPLMGAGGAFTMLFGAVLWMHGSGPWLGLIGLAVVLYTMFGWWSEVVHEGQTGDHTPVVRIGLRYGVIMFIMSEVMFFAAWFWAFFKNAMYPMGPLSPLKRVVPEGKTTCSLCSRLRRAILYSVADRLQCTKVALGHHRDDILATMLLNLFYGGRMKGMPPKLVSDDGKHVVIRPLCYVPERDTRSWAEYQQFPIIPCNLCGSQDGLQRVAVNEMLREWEKKHPGRIESMFRAMGHVVTTHMMDPKLHDFKNAKATGMADPQGDIAFDDEPLPMPQVVQRSRSTLETSLDN